MGCMSKIIWPLLLSAAFCVFFLIRSVRSGAWNWAPVIIHIVAESNKQRIVVNRLTVWLQNSPNRNGFQRALPLSLSLSLSAHIIYVAPTKMYFLKSEKKTTNTRWYYVMRYPAFFSSVFFILDFIKYLNAVLPMLWLQLKQIFVTSVRVCDASERVGVRHCFWLSIESF